MLLEANAKIATKKHYQAPITNLLAMWDRQISSRITSLKYFPVNCTLYDQNEAVIPISFDPIKVE